MFDIYIFLVYLCFTMIERKNKVISFAVDEKMWKHLGLVLRTEKWRSPSEYLRFKIAQDIKRYFEKDRTLRSFLDAQEEEGVTRLPPDEKQMAPPGLHDEINLDFLK